MNSIPLGEGGGDKRFHGRSYTFSCNGTGNCVSINVAKALCDSADTLALSFLPRRRNKARFLPQDRRLVSNHRCRADVTFKKIRNTQDNAI